MQRKFGKYLGLAFAAGGMGVITYCIYLIFSMPHVNFGTLGILLILGGGFTFAGLGVYVRIRKFEERDFVWFKRNNPNSCRENGEISCPSCKSNQIRVRGLMEQSYTREHFCGACGTTLFYSPEG
jgi:hypothetical protein